MNKMQGAAITLPLLHRALIAEEGGRGNPSTHYHVSQRDERRHLKPLPKSTHIANSGLSMAVSSLTSLVDLAIVPGSISGSFRSAAKFVRCGSNIRAVHEVFHRARHRHQSGSVFPLNFASILAPRRHRFHHNGRGPVVPCKNCSL